MRSALLSAGILAQARSFSGTSLTDSFDASIFFLNGTVHATDSFAYTSLQCGCESGPGCSSDYAPPYSTPSTPADLEGENISTVMESWGVGCDYMIFANETGGGGPCVPSAPSHGFDLPGGDLRSTVLPQDNYTLCVEACCAEPQCQAWVYVPSAPAVFESCNPGDHCCYLKSSTPQPAKNTDPGIVSGTARTPAPNGNYTAPPLGMRSAVPLGGIGAGAFEIRADGSVHEFTIINMSPAGSAKFGVVGDFALGVRAGPASGGGPAVARAMRTSPPAGVPGVDALTYSGSYPLSRWVISDAALPLPVTVYAYSTLKPGDMVGSGAPAVAFTAVFDNSAGSEALNVSLLLNVPMGAPNNCAHLNGKLASASAQPDAPSCQRACAAQPPAGCASWQWESAAGNCSLFSDVAHVVYSRTASCGVRGTWSTPDAGAALTLGLHPAAGVGGPLNGDFTLQAVLDDADPAQTFAFATGDSLADVWAQYAAGAFGASVPAGTTAADGAVLVQTTVAPGARASASAVFAWYFPDRDHAGQDIGNYYTTVWDGSVEVAAQLGTTAALAGVVADLNAHHAVFAGPGASMPEWLQDACINMMSHFRGLIWTRDGRSREFEAYDCPDLDSVHNDYQRHLGYLWVMPEFERSKMREWAAGQAGDGHIQEYLGAFSISPIDEPGGRVMGDVTTIWILELLETYLQTGDLDFVTELYPNVVRGLNWMVTEAAEIGLPWKLVCTYDIIDFQQYNTTTFNSYLYIAALRAGGYLAGLFNDTATVTLTAAAEARAATAMDALLWNSTYDYWRAYTGGDAIMADCMYGVMVGHHHGVGWVGNTTRLAMQLAAEAKYNLNPYGLTVVTGRHTPPPVAPVPASTASPVSRRAAAVAVDATGSIDALGRLGVDTQDDTQWLGAGPTWSYVGLALGEAVSGLTIEQALEPTRRTVENHRTRLADWWNLVGLTAGPDWPLPGYPYITSHYGFALPTWYLPYILSGQKSNIAHGSLTFAPLYAPPYVLPLLLPGTTGTIAAESAGAGATKFTVALAFGQLSLPAGGLAISGVPYPRTFALAAGESISWTG